MGRDGDHEHESAVAVAQRFSDCFNAVDFEAMREVLAPDIVFQDFQHAPDQDPIVRGHEELLKTFRFYLDSFEDFSTELIDPFAVGDGAAIGTIEWRGTGAGSDVPFVHRTVDVVWVSAGRITHYSSGFLSLEEAVKAIEADRRPG